MLGIVFDISRSFFVKHAFNPPRGTPWEAIFGNWLADHWKPSKNGQSSDPTQQDTTSKVPLRASWHVDGVVEFEQHERGRHARFGLLNPNFVHRLVAYSENYGWSAGTRISYVLARPVTRMFRSLRICLSTLTDRLNRCVSSGCPDAFHRSRIAGNTPNQAKHPRNPRP